ncbi:MAG: UDP-N-acetylmuramate dehydrogenase [Lachnospiraceae bacterium]|nr:UDP-N-acetylmuramate dehydrogenase [Lachnospiraceae bacterium]
MNTAFLKFVEELYTKEDILEAEPMSRHTTFRVGGPADCFLQVSSTEQLAATIHYLNLVESEYFVLGNGSNLLVSDKGYRGVILQIGPKMSEVSVEGTLVRAQAGASMAKTARMAMEHGLTGLEFASGIPGTIGGGVVMNAGAYGGEMKQVVESVTVLAQDGQVMVLDNEAMEFGYRTSAIKNRRFVVTEVTFRLQEGEKAAVSAKMEELAQQRKAKQPLEYPSAGSTFKRPEGYFAGKLIMDAGMRGFRIGGAQVSEKHCGFLINAANASAQDIYDLMEEVKERVYHAFEVRLEPEVILLGEF